MVHPPKRIGHIIRCALFTHNQQCLGYIYTISSLNTGMMCRIVMIECPLYYWAIGTFQLWRCYAICDRWLNKAPLHGIWLYKRENQEEERRSWTEGSGLSGKTRSPPPPPKETAWNHPNQCMSCPQIVGCLPQRTAPAETTGSPVTCQELCKSWAEISTDAGKKVLDDQRFRFKSRQVTETYWISCAFHRNLEARPEIEN